LEDVNRCFLDNSFDIDVVTEVVPFVAVVSFSGLEGVAGDIVDTSCWKFDGFLLLKCWCWDLVRYRSTRRGKHVYLQ
jgi:hypothetical protein